MEEGECIVIAIFPVFREAATSIEPSDGAFNNPALRFNDEAFGVVATFDDVDLKVRHDCRDAALKDRAAIGTVCEQLPQERELSKQSGQQQNTPRRDPGRRRQSPARAAAGRVCRPECGVSCP